RAVLRPEDRPRGAHVQAAGVRAVLAHVRGHQPAELGRVRGCAIGAREVARRGRPAGAGGPRTDAGHAEADQLPAGLPSLLDPLLALFDEGDVPPGVGAELTGVVVARAEDLQVAVDRVAVPLLARHLAGLAADADRGVGEEALARMGAAPASIGRGPRRAWQHAPRCLVSFLEAWPVGAAEASSGPRRWCGVQESAGPAPGAPSAPSTAGCSCGISPARRRYASTSAPRPRPRGRRPGMIVHE